MDIRGLELDELTDYIAELGLQKFRAKQLYEWLHKKQVKSLTQATNLPKDLVEKIGEYYNLEVEQHLVSQNDGTQKFLYRLHDGNFIETVLMEYKHGNSICISSQVGCKMGCKFCASTKSGFVRNLTSAELLDQIYTTSRITGKKINNVVLMGIGEPLDNFDNVVKFMRILSSKDGLQLSLRHLSLSTCGLVPRIKELIELKLPMTLSVSLHHYDNYSRSKSMPINNKHDIHELVECCRLYALKTSRRVSFEYALIQGYNDSVADAKKLAGLLRGMLCHVNLIPVNPIKEVDYKRSNDKTAMEFKAMLERCGITATIRRTLGEDINAACGQLRNQQKSEQEGTD